MNIINSSAIKDHLLVIKRAISHGAEFCEEKKEVSQQNARKQKGERERVQ